MEGLVPEFIGAYRVGSLIMETDHALIYESYHPEQCQKLVIKCIKKAIHAPEVVEAECSIMRSLSHPHCVALVDEIDLPDFRCLVMPLATGGDVYNYIKDNHLNEVQGCQIVHETLHALAHLHGQGIAHRDLKPENLLIDDASTVDLQIRLCDFGFARQFAVGETSTQEVGTAFYAAPEIHLRQEHNQAVDMWSLGVTTYEILSGESPWPPSGEDMVKAIIMCDYEFDSDVWDGISEQAKDLIRGLITREPGERLTVEDALSHPWFDNVHNPKFTGATVAALGITDNLLGIVADDVLCGEDIDRFDGF